MTSASDPRRLSAAAGTKRRRTRRCAAQSGEKTVLLAALGARAYARPTEPRLFMRTLTSSVISVMPGLAGFLGSKAPGFSAM